jgi:hypothetical protein
MTSLPIDPRLAVTPGRRPALIWVETSRACPRHRHESREPNGREDLDEHTAAVVPLTFHTWVAADGRYSHEVTGPDEVVLPRGLCWPWLASRMYVVCLSGWYHSSRARGEGGESAPLPRALAELERVVAETLKRFDLATCSITGPWDNGQHAWAGDAVEASMRHLRGEVMPYRPENRYETMPPLLVAVNERRAALRQLGYSATYPASEPNGAWNIDDLQALLAYQHARGVEPTGWWDPITVVSMRESLAQR